MSAQAVESAREKAIATGCDEFDAKPAELESLVATIRRVLEHRPFAGLALDSHIRTLSQHRDCGWSRCNCQTPLTQRRVNSHAI
jgi:DNA-binding NarL/FixJ family response regulator